MLQVLAAGAVGYVLGGATMDELFKKLQKSMGKIYARQIHAGRCTLDEVKPQTEEYREYVRQCYYEIYHEEL